MRFAWSSGFALLGALAYAEAVDKPEVKNVAIIGAGAAGSSAAFHLKRYAEEEGLNINITVFERTARIGGRTTTTNVFDDPSQPVEVGASIFVTINHILYNASQYFDLPIGDPYEPEQGDLTAIWDGEQFVFESAEGTSWWWDAAKLWWKYGMAPYKAVKLVKAEVGKFLKLYEAPYFPFRSLTQRAFELNLEKTSAITGEQFLEQNKIDSRFTHEIMQAATRVNYASNLAYIHGLETMVSFATDGAIAVQGGNWQIFEHMLLDSSATLMRNTTVASISLAKTKDKGTKYNLSTKEGTLYSTAAEEYGLDFDNVIIAAPWQFSHIEAGEGVLQHTIDEIPYMKLHVTLFTSPLRLHGEFFGLEPGVKVPSSVYTTLAKGDVPKQGPEGVGSAGFYSISTLKPVINPKTSRREYAYKIFSPEAVTPEFLSKILGANIPPTFVSPEGETRGGEEATFEPISWYYPYWFYAYPIELPRVTFQDPIVGEGLYYTSGIESFISTMETSALMGKNVARLIADDFAGISREPDVVPGKTDNATVLRDQQQEEL